MHQLEVDIHRAYRGYWAIGRVEILFQLSEQYLKLFDLSDGQNPLPLHLQIT